MRILDGQVQAKVREIANRFDRRTQSLSRAGAAKGAEWMADWLLEPVCEECGGEVIFLGDRLPYWEHPHEGPGQAHGGKWDVVARAEHLRRSPLFDRKVSE